MVEMLTERNLDLEEKVRELRETVTDLVRENKHLTEFIQIKNSNKRVKTDSAHVKNCRD